MANQISDLRLRQLIEQGEYFDARRKRAAARRAALPPGELCFGVAGLQYSGPDFDFHGLLALRCVEEPPTEVELAGAITPAHLFGAVGRYSQAIRHEIATSIHDHADPDPKMNLAWWFASLLRIRSGVEFLVPAVSWESWGSLAALDGNTCRMSLLEDYPLTLRLEPTLALEVADLEWVKEHLLDFAQMLEAPNFRIAVEAASDHAHQGNLRMAVARIWTGIESLCGVRQELRFRLSLYISALLESPGAGRKQLSLRVRKLYDVRSAAVHGAPIAESLLLEHVREARTLLRGLVVRFLESRRLFTVDDLESILLGC